MMPPVLMFMFWPGEIQLSTKEQVKPGGGGGGGGGVFKHSCVAARICCHSCGRQRCGGSVLMTLVNGKPSVCNT
jgi:hypothetical protein